MNLLAPYRVLDLTNDLGFLAGKIFGDLGAQVIKVEPPSGDPSRRRPPFPENNSGCPQSLYWEAYNSNKRGITLDLSQQQGRELFCRLVTTADFVIESFKPGTLREWGLDYETLSRENPGLINDPAFVEAHPTIKVYLVDHPEARKELVENPNRFIHRDLR